MSGVERLLEHVAPFLLVLTRLGGLFVFTPLLASAAVPARARAVLAVALAVAVYPAVVMGGPAEMRMPASIDLFTLGPLIASEALIGVSIGLLASVPIFAAQMGGAIVGQQIGVGLASVYNPAMETESDVVGELMMYLALATFVALGGLEATFGALVATFRSVPVGGFAATDAPLAMLVGLLASGFELALRVAAPVLAILTLETLAASIVMKTMPQINILTIGFAIKTVIGFLVLAGSLYVLEGVIAEEVMKAGGAVLRWAGGG